MIRRAGDAASRNSLRRVLHGLMIATTLMVVGCEKEHVASEAPVAVNGDNVELKPGSASWSYVELAQAAMGPALPPAPVPARVAVDETRTDAVVAPLQGRVDAVVVQLGQRVHDGDRLLSIRSAGLVDLFREIELMRAKESARAKVAERVRDLVRLKAAPEKDLIAAEQDLHQSQLSRESAEAKLRSLSVETASEGLFWVKAPRSGVIVERNVLVGQEAGPDRGDPLLQIAELDQVIVKADVPESDVIGVHVGDSASVTSSAIQERHFDGKVEHVGEVVDPERRMVDVRVRVPNVDGLLRPNAFVQVEFIPDGQQRILVNAAAVVTDDQQSYVFVEPSGQTTQLQRRLVQTGRRRDNSVEIVQGLQAGETYVAKGAILLLNAIDIAS